MNIAKQFVKVDGIRDGKLKTSQVRIDGGTQSRAAIDPTVVDDYAAALGDGVSLPPIVVFYDGNDYWLADGFHRHEAHRKAGMKVIDADVRQGTRRDAILYSVGANASHGLRRSNDDKRRAVGTLLNDPEWAKWSDRQIAAACRVDHKTVGKVRSEVTGEIPSERTYTTKHGTVATMDTAAIGKQPEPAPLPATEEHSAFRDQARESLPQAIKDMETAKQRAMSDRKEAADPELYDGLTAEDRIAELEEAVRVLEAEAEALKVENKKYGEMRAQFDQGGFASVIAGKDEEIRVLKTRLYRESEDKAGWAKSAKWWKQQAIEHGWSNELVIPLDEPAEEAE